MNITLRQLSYFKALAKHAHFGRAAEAVHVSQPALSVQIRELETTLGAALVERGPRRVVLTAFGRTVLAQTDKVLAEMQVMQDMARWKGGLAGDLRLGLIPTVAPYLLPGALAAIRARDIGLNVQVEEAKTARLLDDLFAGRLDAAVIALPADAPGLVELPLFEDRFLLAGSPARLQAMDPAARNLTPEDLGRTPLMLLEDGHCLTDQALAVCGRGREHALINMGASSLATLSRLVAAGFGLTLMPELAAGVEGQGLAMHRFATPEPSRTIGLVRRASSPDDGWFHTLGTLLAETGAEITRAVRAQPA
ncbi:LysR substrate-binding domain-containing protein [Pseudooceanicola aestuarii]|uniref:LysR substrate-binding domain-containing protein n=1 Tax=Pseudooceanicola aestuarii TaxID=2697319 RepID=UPI0013D73487|nr:LysR substrate-binding domain-containing protein [Pseudooceanicola aestuarii]